MLKNACTSFLPLSICYLVVYVLIMLMVFLYCHDDMQTLNIHGLSRVPEVRLPTYDVWIMTGFQLSYMMH